MTIHRIRLLGDPVLRSKCDHVVNAGSPAIRIVADDLQETLKDVTARLGFGRALSAPQIGAPVRLIHLAQGEHPFLVNPEIEDIGTRDFFVCNDCFSFPDLLVRVHRSYQVTVRFTDLKGKEHLLEAEGPLAELLQHELDHLDGVLAIDRADGLDPFFYREEWNKHHPKESRLGEPFSRAEIV
jgi:peptide deformylase